MKILKSDKIGIITKKAKGKNGIYFYVKNIDEDTRERIYLKIKMFNRRPLLHFVFENNIYIKKIKLIFNSLKDNFKDDNYSKDFLDKFEVSGWGCSVLVHRGSEMIVIKEILNLKYNIGNWEIIFITD